MGEVYYPLGRDGDSEMSEGERMMADCEDAYLAGEEDEYAAQRYPVHRDTPEGIWEAKSGEIRIRDMTDAHVQNAILWMLRNACEDHPKFDELVAEQTRRSLSPVEGQ
jgi:hypothetical protein